MKTTSKASINLWTPLMCQVMLDYTDVLSDGNLLSCVPLPENIDALRQRCG